MPPVRAGKRAGLPAPYRPPEATASDRPLFAYGTLAEAAFVARLLERPVAAEPAELVDFVKLEPVGFAYPVVLAAAGERTAGVLYRRLTEEDWRRLDAYEGVGEGLYFRDLARATAPGAPPESAAPAWVYLPTERTVRRITR
jgi:gamma-glutamylcyclotransferase (GGCT)/AIG2-like uncharacterized protein YtfP